MSFLDRLKNLFADLSGADGDDPAPAFADGDHRLAAAALAFHLIAVDGVVEDVERERLRDILKARYDLDDAETEELMELARLKDLEAVDLYGFTSILKRALDEDQRGGVVEMLWELVYADGTVHEFEDNVVWRVAELLGVSPRERIRLRQIVEAREEDT
ncbi:MAG: TerB family tellurite resistance protein [Pseudomonadota bacterium]